MHPQADGRTDGWDPARELGESIALIGLLLLAVGSTVGAGLMAVRVLAG